jgi:NADPH2:quinone reductase
MKAIRQDEFGAAEVLRYAEVPDPEPGPGQVRIDVAAAGVHLIDTSVRAGLGGGPFPLPALPMTPGREVAGTVGALGPDVDPDWRGRVVVAHLGQANGGYAERAVAAVGSLHPVPEGLSPAEAVAMIGTGRTVLAVLEVAPPGPDDVVLVPAAAGGIGPLLVQAGRRAGATVVGLAGGPEKVARVRALGADVAEDYRDPGWADRVREQLGGATVTVLFDGVGGEVGRAALDLLAAPARVVLFGYSAGSVTALTSADIVARSLQVTWAIGPRILRRPGGLRPLEEAALAAAARRELVPLVHPPFPLADAAGAHRALESRATTGKVILAP